jgi:hypothetical protein
MNGQQRTLLELLGYALAIAFVLALIWYLPGCSALQGVPPWVCFLAAFAVVSFGGAGVFSAGLSMGKRSRNVLRPILTGKHVWHATSEGIWLAFDGGVIVAMVTRQAGASDAFDAWIAYVRVPEIGGAGTLQWNGAIETLEAAKARADNMLKQQFAHLLASARRAS